MDKNKDKSKKLSKRELHLNEVKDMFGTEAGEDSSKYGEFVCSYFAWVSPSEQKKIVEKLQDVTKKK